jgi:hypothetical protein
MFLIMSRSNSRIIPNRRSFRLDESSWGSFLDLRIANLVFILTRTESNYLSLFALLTNSPRIHFVYKVVVLIVMTRTDSRIISYW